MKTILALLAATGLIATGCNNQAEQESAPMTSEPAGAQPGTPSETGHQPTSKEITAEHDWAGTNEAGRSTNFGISPGGANTRGRPNE